MINMQMPTGEYPLFTDKPVFACNRDRMNGIIPLQTDTIMKFNVLKMTFLFAGLFAGGTLSAQEKAQAAKISGKVADEKTQPVDFSTIRLMRSKDSSLVRTGVTNQEGVYLLENISPGTYIVSASMGGYKTAYSKPVSVSGNHTIETLSLVPAVKNLKEVALTTQKPLIERKMDRLVLNVESSTLAAGSTAMEVLEKAPGVTVDKDDNISMKGKQGVLIMLDGKPTYMSNADVANMLRNMQSAQIETIELITSPSAKYDAAGTSGIINIKTKRNKSVGANGSFTAGAGYGLTSKYNGGGTLNYRRGKVNLFGNYNYANNGRLNNLDLHRQVTFKDTVTNFSQFNDWDNRRNSNSYKAGADFFLHKNHTVGILVNGYANRNDEVSTSNTDWINNYKQSELILVNGNNREEYSNNAVNLNYKGVLDKKGKELSVDLDYSDYNSGHDEIRGNSYTRINLTPRNALNVKNFAPSEITVKSFKSDYAHPLKSAKLEAGIKSSFVKTDNDLLLARESAAGYIADPEYTNHFIYDENIYAGYLNFSREFKSTGIQAGLRAEQTHSKGNSITKNQVVDRNYLQFFPSIAFSQKAGKDHQFGLSYSRRIDRPSYDDLNPFLNFLDEYTFQKGNPFLNPQFTNSFDLSHTYKGKFNTSLNYSHTTDLMAFVTEQDDETKKTFATQQNLDKQDVVSLNVYAPFKPLSWWTLNTNFQVFHATFTSALNGGNLKAGQTAVTYNMDQSFTFSKSSGADLSTQYQSPMQYGIFKSQAQLVFNAGLRTSFMNNKASLRLNISDIFNGRRNRLSTTYQNMNLNFTEKPESQIARLTFSYRFGKNEVKAARKRATGLEDEAGRMKN